MQDDVLKDDVDVCLGIRERAPAEALATLLDWRVERMGGYDGLDPHDRRAYGSAADAFREGELEAGFRRLLMAQQTVALQMCMIAIDYLDDPGVPAARAAFIDTISCAEHWVLRDALRRRAADAGWVPTQDQVDRMWSNASSFGGAYFCPTVLNLHSCGWLPSREVRQELEKTQIESSSPEELAATTRILLELAAPKHLREAARIGL